MKRSKVIIAVIAIIAVVAAACVYGYVRSKPADEPEKPAVTEPENPTTPDDSNSGKPSDSKTNEPAAQPENPNPSGTESVTIYVPDEQGETLTPTGADAKDDSDQSLVDALIAAGSLPEGVKVQSSSLENGTLTQFVCPSQPVQRKRLPPGRDEHADAVRAPRSAGAEKTAAQTGAKSRRLLTVYPLYFPVRIDTIGL